MSEELREKIARLRELLAKATPGDWHAGSREHMIGSGPTHLIAYDPAWGVMDNGRATPGIIATGNPNDIASSSANIELIVAMRNLLPALIDHLEADGGVEAMRERCTNVADEAKAAFERERTTKLTTGFDNDRDWYLAGKRDGAGSIATALSALPVLGVGR